MAKLMDHFNDVHGVGNVAKGGATGNDEGEITFLLNDPLPSLFRVQGSLLNNFLSRRLLAKSRRLRFFMSFADDIQRITHLGRLVYVEIPKPSLVSLKLRQKPRPTPRVLNPF
jgi:hypothetical protein